MDQIIHGIEKCVCKQDGILAGENDWQENLKILAEVLGRLHKYNLHLKHHFKAVGNFNSIYYNLFIL